MSTFPGSLRARRGGNDANANESRKVLIATALLRSPGEVRDQGGGAAGGRVEGQGRLVVDRQRQHDRLDQLVFGDLTLDVAEPTRDVVLGVVAILWMIATTRAVVLDLECTDTTVWGIAGPETFALGAGTVSSAGIVSVSAGL